MLESCVHGYRKARKRMGMQQNADRSSRDHNGSSTPSWPQKRPPCVFRVAASMIATIPVIASCSGTGAISMPLATAPALPISVWV